MLDAQGLDDCAGAIFIYKRDGSVPDAIKGALAVARAHRTHVRYTQEELTRIVRVLGYDPTAEDGRFVRVVVATTKDEFLSELARWNQAVPAGTGALLVYAHMGEPGLAPARDAIEDIVTWQELGGVLTNKVSSLWLAGCTSAWCLAAWATPAASPVLNWLACTVKSEYWAPLITRFYGEISLDPVLTPRAIAKLLQNQAGNVEYLEVSGNVWTWPARA